MTIRKKPEAEAALDVVAILGGNIRRARRFRSWRQEDLARAVGRSKQAVSGWEKGRNPPDLELLPQLAEALEVSYAFLFDGAAASRLPARGSIEWLQRQLLQRIGSDPALLAALLEHLDDLRLELATAPTAGAKTHS